MSRATHKLLPARQEEAKIEKREKIVAIFRRHLLTTILVDSEMEENISEREIKE